MTKHLDMLCRFEAVDGRGPVPIRFRLRNEEGEDQVIGIERIVQREIERLAGTKMYVYRCEVKLQGLCRVVVIKYAIAECLWVLTRVE